MTKISSELKHLVMLPICALFFFIGAVTAQAATYYVATTGNDAHTCANAQTVTTPKRTIASGAACLNPGDTLYVRSGTYTTPIDTRGHSGTAGNPITVAAYPGEKVTIRPAGGNWTIYPDANQGYIVYDGFHLDGASLNPATEPQGIWIYSNMHNITIQNSEIVNFHSSGFYIEGDNITLRNNTVHDQISTCQCVGERWYGIYFHHGNNGLIEGNDIYDNPGGGMQAYPGPISNLVIRGNKFHDNNFLASSDVDGITVSEGTTNGVQQAITGVQIYNNLVYNNGSAPTHGKAGGIRVSSGPDATKIWNNTVYGNSYWGINIQNGVTKNPTNTIVQNNIVYGNTAGQIVNVGINTTFGANLCNVGGEGCQFVGNPRFVNAAESNFNLNANSPAIDAGVPLSTVKTDFKKTPRPQGATYDIGAYEVGTGSDTASPNTPLGLRVN